MNEDKFEYTITGVLKATAYLQSISELDKVTDSLGAVDSNNVVAYANVRYGALNKITSIPISYKDMYGEDEPENYNNDKTKETEN